MADYPYKTKIVEAVLAHQDRFQIPGEGAQEFPLQDRCRADFCFTMMPEGRLFIEDDDAMRGLGNLVKYWIWCDANPDTRPVHVVHILEASRPAAVKGIRFLGEQMQRHLDDFSYHVITLPNWQIPDENWLPELRGVLSDIRMGKRATG